MTPSFTDRAERARQSARRWYGSRAPCKRMSGLFPADCGRVLPGAVACGGAAPENRLG